MAGDPPSWPYNHHGPIYDPTQIGYANSVVINDGTTWAWAEPPDDPDRIVSPEELKIRRENDFVRELYEQYKVALILASGDEEL